MIKPRLPQKGTLDKSQPRDNFQTPNYATELLVPFIPKKIEWVWECACGYNKITNVLKKHGYLVLSSDIVWEKNGEVLDHVTPFNFLTDGRSDVYKPSPYAIITNPPYSLKRQFFNRCLQYDLPFALLISGDYSLWTIDAIRKYGCEKIIPDHRIDYITPTGLSGKSGHTSYFHSYWLTRDFNLGKTETFVTLTKEMKENI